MGARAGSLGIRRNGWISSCSLWIYGHRLKQAGVQTKCTITPSGLSGLNWDFSISSIGFCFLWQAFTRSSQQPRSETSLSRLRARISNLRQVIAGMFLAFGALFFWSLPGAFNTLALSRGYPVSEYIGAFRLHFVFAANVFSILLMLHCIKWFVSRRVLPGESNTGKQSLMPRRRNATMRRTLWCCMLPPWRSGTGRSGSGCGESPRQSLLGTDAFDSSESNVMVDDMAPDSQTKVHGASLLGSASFQGLGAGGDCCEPNPSSEK